MYQLCPQFAQLHPGPSIYPFFALLCETQQTINLHEKRAEQSTRCSRAQEVIFFFLPHALQPTVANHL